MKNLKNILILMLLVGLTAPLQAKVLSYKKDSDGITCTLNKGLMKVKLCFDNMVEVKYTTLPLFIEKPSLVITNPFKSAPSFDVAEKAGELVITTPKLKITIDKASNAVKYFDLSGNAILAEDDSQNKTMEPTTIAGIDVYNCTSQFQSPADEALFGLGCHPEDSLSINYKGRNQELAIRYMTGAIPVMLSTKGYGLFWDNYSASNFYGAEAGNTKYKYVSESGNMVDYYFIYGPDFDNIISTFRNASGNAPMFPKWALGLFQSQDRYKSQAEILSVKDGYRNNKIPVDVIVQDWFYWEPNVIGSHVMWPERYPNPKAMVDELHNSNIHAMISIWPVFSKGTEPFNQMSHSGGMTDIRWLNVMTNILDYYYDAHSPQARDLYWRQACDSLIGRFGWDAWWVDQCEPDNGNIGVDKYMDLRRQSHFAIGRGIDYMNTFSLMHSTGLYEHWRKEIADKRVFLLIRQAFAGQQRNSATLWSSDITCTWKAFRNQVPQGINACASGIPYWTSDIGGYHLNWQAPDWTTPTNQELFTRWFQFGTFSPIFRIHGKGERAIFSKNWSENTRSVLMKYDNLRYRLMPYLYSLSWKVTNEGYTIMRSLGFDFRNDDAVKNIPDQYMFGPAFLVNPVTQQLYSAPDSKKIAKTRKVYLPKSTNWYDFWTGKQIEGGKSIDAKATIETMPLYIKAGSIVPMGPYLQYANEKPADPIELRVYAGADADFVIYEDENDNYNYEKGKFATIPLHWNEAAKTLTIGNRQGEFAGMVKDRSFRVVLVNAKNGMGIEPAKTAKTVQYNGAEVSVKNL
ncbi:glycoside hydrolase family 31 protein [Paludibacter jiangxiensis]|uniref:Alpha-D-xyloside xylohydrolase n=1 Tax=Paludibacter jiangxiensis TaxID=681398 RepID=A0A161L7U6_9BACT|nr:TIM-barrel domain-containing protein [Paludibacter jiangxiensis]GAT62914.1 alpha-D-xyloside xylohydrolase [Paludibacter jiangxiensis]